MKLKIFTVRLRATVDNPVLVQAIANKPELTLRPSGPSSAGPSCWLDVGDANTKAVAREKAEEALRGVPASILSIESYWLSPTYS